MEIIDVHATLANAAVEIGNLTLGGLLALEDASLDVAGDLQLVEPSNPGACVGIGCGGPTFNPSYLGVANLLGPTTGDPASFLWDFGLGGLAPASIGNTGNGHYATLHATGDADLFGHLAVSLFYGFTPSVGDLFNILTIDGAASGQFANVAEGGLVQTFGGVGLFLTYEGGDGNDVVLSAQAAPVPEPGTGWMLATGLVGLIGYGYRRRTAA